MKFTSLMQNKSRTPKQIQKTISRYQKLKSFSCEGQIVENVSHDKGTIIQNSRFSMILDRSGSFKIVWTEDQNPPLRPGGPKERTAAVWNTSASAFIDLGFGTPPEPHKNARSAIAGATGISHGLAYEIPQLFFKIFTDASGDFAHLSKLKLLRTETIDGKLYYRIEGEIPDIGRETYWISTDEYLIRKYVISMKIKRNPKDTEEAQKQIKKIQKEAATTNVKFIEDMRRTSLQLRRSR